MIAVNYAKNILNFLFATEGTAGVTPEGELQDLLDLGLPTLEEGVIGVTGEQVYNMQINSNDTGDEKIRKRKLLEQDESYKNSINATEWYHVYQITDYKDELVVDYPQLAYEYYSVSGNDAKKQYAYGWLALKNDKQQPKFPANRYLALFTTMPDVNGKNYAEPNHKETTYQRVNLNKGYFSGNPVMRDAVLDSENGGTVIKNKEVIYFPEIADADWATDDAPLVGFGIFSEESVGVGSPYLWGKFSNGSVSATQGHVPLFRVEDFQFSIS